MGSTLYKRRLQGMFMYVDNEEEMGFLVVSDDFQENIHKGYHHPEMWEIFMNRQVRGLIL